MSLDIMYETEVLGRSVSVTSRRTDLAQMVREVRQERAEILGGAIGKTIANAALKLGYGLKKLAHAVESWRQRRATYGELSQLDDRLLADIGIQRADIQVIAAASTDRRVGSGREPSAVGLTRAV